MSNGAAINVMEGSPSLRAISVVAVLLQYHALETTLPSGQLEPTAVLHNEKTESHRQRLPYAGEP